MREGHTISATEKEWNEVFTYAKNHSTNISDVTRQAWKEFFSDEKNYRVVDIIIVFLLISIFVLFLGVMFL